MRHLWALPPVEVADETLPPAPRVCNGCGVRVEQRERVNLRARVPGQMVSVPVYVLPGGRETEKLPDCDRRLLAHLVPSALPLGVKPTPAQELAELRVRFGQVQKENERLFAQDVQIRGLLGAEIEESTVGALERVLLSFVAGGAR